MLVVCALACALAASVAEARPKRSNLPFAGDDSPPASERPLTPARISLGDATALGVVIDTSGSMRNFKTLRLLEAVAGQVTALLEANPKIKLVQLLDTDGRFIAKSESWLPVDPALPRTLSEALARWDTASNANPTPGMVRFLHRVHDSPAAGHKIALCVLGDEFEEETLEPALERLDRSNPKAPDGSRLVAIHAVIFPYFGGAGALSSRRLHELLSKVTTTHGGSLAILQ